MCMLAAKSAAELPRILAEWTRERRAFDALAVRDELRRRVPDEDVRYGDVFSEIWHAFRKGGLRDYVVRTKLVMVDSRAETTVEYVPAETTVLKRVLQAWDRGRTIAALCPEAGKAT